MIVIPLIIAWISFISKKRYFDIAYLGLVPLITYGLSSTLKHIVERPRPPIEYHLSVHPGGFSYVSSHTVISFCLWGMVIYYLINYCENKFWRNTGITIASVWMAMIGFSRVWLGVHNPTDVLAGYLLGAILLIVYIRVREFTAKYIGL
jgi:undecaprenyl-diphosphatase